MVLKKKQSEFIDLLTVEPNTIDDCKPLEKHSFFFGSEKKDQIHHLIVFGKIICLMYRLIEEAKSINQSNICCFCFVFFDCNKTMTTSCDLIDLFIFSFYV